MNDTIQQLDGDSENEDHIEWFDGVTSGIDSKRVAAAGILAALSIAIAPVAEFIPRIPGWGIALFDPVSIIWIIAFLIGGFWIGIVTTLAGTMGLFLYDPTGIGPFFKIVATLPMIVIPYLGLKLRRQADSGSNLASPRKYTVLMLVALLVRLSLMVPLNIIIVPLFFDWGIEQIVQYTVILNVLQSLWDALVPYLVVYPTGLYRHYGMW
ncbi:MAG: conserved membrane protein of unknown function [Candidatus Thorarchaeota archaeon]|nr:MAG: conserved membrane protein of unknown function [Candidatus Thorarchaeota archaeon]